MQLWATIKRGFQLTKRTIELTKDVVGLTLRLVPKIAFKSLDMAIKTGIRTLSIPPAILKTVMTFRDSERAQRLAAAFWFSFKQNAPAIVALGLALEAHEYLQPQEDEDMPDANWTLAMTNQIVTWSLTGLLRGAKARFVLQFALHMLMLERKALAMNPDRPHRAEKSSDCTESLCTPEIAITAGIKDNLAFSMMVGACHVVGQVSPTTGDILLHIVNGRFVASLRVPHCAQHRYVDPYSALAHGTWMWGLRTAFNQLMQQTLGMSSTVLSETAEQVILFTQIIVSMHMKPPKAPEGRNLLPSDPIAAVEKFIFIQLEQNFSYVSKKLPDLLFYLIKNAGTDLYRLNELPLAKDYSRYAFSYLFVEGHLYYMTPGSELIGVRLSKPEEFTQKIQELLGPKKSFLHLLREQVKELITKNGGHIPANYWLEMGRYLYNGGLQAYNSPELGLLARVVFPPVITNFAEDPIVLDTFGDVRKLITTGYEDFLDSLTVYLQYFIDSSTIQISLTLFSTAPNAAAGIIIKGIKAQNAFQTNPTVKKMVDYLLRDEDKFAQLIVGILKTMRTPYYREYLDKLASYLEDRQRAKTPLQVTAGTTGTLALLPQQPSTQDAPQEPAKTSPRVSSNPNSTFSLKKSSDGTDFVIADNYTGSRT